MEYLERYKAAWSNDSIRHIATPSPLAKSCFYYVQEIGYFQTLDSYFTERSSLNSFLMIYTKSGSGYLTYHGKKHKVSEGQLIFIDCMKHHYYETDADHLWEINWVHFNGSTSRGYYDYFASLSSPVITLPSTSNIPSNMEQLLLLNLSKDLKKEIISSHLIHSILTDLLLQTHKENDLDQLPSSIHEIQTYLEHHFSENINLDHIAHTFNMSKYHLSKLFKKYTGYSPIDYLITQRLLYAKELLHFTDKTIQEISDEIGIENVSHFINLFKSREDLTPLSYRKMWNS